MPGLGPETPSQYQLTIPKITILVTEVMVPSQQSLWHQRFPVSDNSGIDFKERESFSSPPPVVRKGSILVGAITITSIRDEG